MNKKVIKVVTTIVMLILIISVSINSLALTPKEMTGNKAVNGVNEITTVGNNIIGILQTVGIVLSVGILIIIGLKYMMGSAEEKADYKKTLIPYAIGAALIFAASAFAQTIYQFFTGITV